LSGLIDPAALAEGYDARRSGFGAERSPAGRAVVGGLSGVGRSEEAAREEAGSDTYEKPRANLPESLFPAKARLNGSHSPPVIASALAAALAAG
jgi:hypothetical protein